MSSDDTRASLLLRIRDRSNQASWHEFAGVYEPVVRAFARRVGIADHDIDDVVQDVLVAVSEAIGQFDYDPTRGRFRSWLYQVTHHRVSRRRSSGGRREEQAADSGMLKGIADEDAGLERLWEQEWCRHVLSHGMEAAKRHVDLRTFEAFRRYTILDHPAADVAEALGMTVANVYVCKSRVLEHIRREVEALDGTG